MLVRRPGKKWDQPEVSAYPSEGNLQKMIAESPSLLPGVEGPVAVAREFSCHFGSVDIVGVDLSGQIIVCECKAAQNQDLRRKVVGQIFAYAAALWGLSWEEFARQFEAASGDPLVDQVHALADKAGEGDWDEEAFRQETAMRLKVGDFRLVLAVEAIPEELREIVRFLNVHSSSGIEVLALELAYGREGEVEILVPHTWGEEIVTSERPPHHWGEDDLVDALRESVDVPWERVEALWRLLRDRSERLSWGRGSHPSVSCYLKVDGVPQPLFGLYAAGWGGGWPAHLSPGFELMKERVSRDRLVQIAQAVRELPGGRERLEGLEDAGFGKHPVIPLDELLSDPSTVDRIRALLDSVA